MPQRDSYRIQVGEHVFAGRGATRPDERAAGLAAGVYPIRIEYDRAAAKPQVSQAGERLEKREPGMRFQLRWRRGSGGERPVPWWALGRTEADAAAGWAWGAVGIGLLAAAGAVGAWIAVRRAAWDRLFSRRQRVRGLVFALMLVQLGASTAMTIRQTTSRRQWNVLNAYDDKTYERRAQTMLRCGWIGREARQEGAIERSSLMEYYLPGLHLLFGGDYGLMAMAQNVLVCLTVLPAFGLGRLIFRRQAVALLGAALVAVDPTFTEYGRLLLPTAASLFLFIAAVWLLFGGRRSGRWGRFVAGGLVFGLAIMGRTNLVGAVPGALLLILWPGRAALPRRLGQVAVVLAAMVVAWLPVPVRQMQLAGRWMWAPTQGPMILVVFNAPPDPAGHEAYRQDFLRFAERAAPDAETRELLDKFADNAFVRHEGPRAHLIGEPVTPRELLIVNPYLTRFLFEEVAQRPGRFAATVGRKLADFWWTGNAGSHFRPHAILLALALLTSLRRRGRGRAAAVYVMIAGIVAVLVLSWFVERHRSVIVPLIDVMFAGSAVWWVRRLWADLRARLGGNELGSPPAGP